MCITMYQNNSHWAKLVNQGTLVFGLVLQKVIQLVPIMCTTPRIKKYIFTKYMTFLQKSYGYFTKVE